MKRRFFVIGSILVTVGLIVYFLSTEPSQKFQDSSTSWLLARFIALVLALVLGFISYTGGRVTRGVKEIELERKYLKDKNDADLRAQGYNSFEIWLIEAPMIGWLIWWALCFEIMVSFYIADWCKNGF